MIKRKKEMKELKEEKLKTFTCNLVHDNLKTCVLCDFKKECSLQRKDPSFMMLFENIKNKMSGVSEQ